jgi:hypothetical protein
MHHVLFYDDADDFVTERAQFRTAYLARAQLAFERGELMLAGTLADPMDGAVLILGDSSPESAEPFATPIDT